MTTPLPGETLALPMTASPSPELRADSVRYRYPGGSRPALDGVSLAVRGGELLAVAGPNGSGKSTLLSVLLGFLAPEAGSVTLGGTPIADRSPAEVARTVAALPQNEVPLPTLTGLEMAMLGRTPHRSGWLPLPSAEDRATAEVALKRAGAEAFANRRMGTLSGGERQLVRIARALAQGPRLLLLDEPSASLDLAHTQEVFRLLRKLAREEGLGILAIVHDLNIAGAWADRIVLLSEGRIRAEGTPAEVLREEVLAGVFSASIWVGASPDGAPTVGLRP